MGSEQNTGKFDVHSPIEVWPPEVGFVPYVGSDYAKGIDGCRVLLLAESHYLGEQTEQELLAEVPGGKRAYTRHIFGDRGDLGANRVQKMFFRTLDAVVARSDDPTNREAAEGWRRIAFTNFVQDFAASAGTKRRPSKDQWKDAQDTFPKLLECLKPHVVLALGSATWQKLPGLGAKVYELELASSNTLRSVWKIPHGGGSALVSWVYHPSYYGKYRDQRRTYIEVMSCLLQLAVGAVQCERLPWCRRVEK